MSSLASVKLNTLSLTFIVAVLAALVPLSTDIYLASFSSLGGILDPDEDMVRLSLSVYPMVGIILAGGAFALSACHMGRRA